MSFTIQNVLSKNIIFTVAIQECVGFVPLLQKRLYNIVFCNFDLISTYLIASMAPRIPRAARCLIFDLLLSKSLIIVIII